MAGRVGGNRKPQTFRECARCGATFGPVQRLAQRYCSLACKADAQRVDERHRSVATVEARRAQRRIAYLVSVGRMTKPDRCEECGEGRAGVDHRSPHSTRIVRSTEPRAGGRPVRGTRWVRRPRI